MIRLDFFSSFNLTEKIKTGNQGILLFLPVAWIDQSMPVGKWHGLNNPCHWEKNHIMTLTKIEKSNDHFY